MKEKLFGQKMWCISSGIRGSRVESQSSLCYFVGLQFWLVAYSPSAKALQSCQVHCLPFLINDVRLRDQILETGWLGSNSNCPFLTSSLISLGLNVLICKTGILLLLHKIVMKIKWNNICKSSKNSAWNMLALNKYRLT